MCQSHKDEGVWTRAHITVCALHVRIQGSNVRKCAFSLYEELRVTQCSRIPPEGTQWSVRPARRNKKQKHKAFIHSPRSLYLSLARLRSSVSFYLRLITLFPSPSSSVHIDKSVIGWNVVVQCFSHSFFVGSMKERHGFQKEREKENNTVKTEHGSTLDLICMHTQHALQPPFVFKCFCSYSCTDLLFALVLIPLKQSGVCVLLTRFT